MAICFYQFSSRRLFKHFKPRSQWKKWSVRHQVVLFNVLNDEFVVGHIGLGPARCGHISSACARPVCRYCAFSRCNVWKLIFCNAVTLLGVVTSVFCNNLFIADFLLSVTMKEFLKNGPTLLKYPPAYFFEPPCRVIALHLRRWYYGSIFIQIFVAGSERRTRFETECIVALQGHPRSLILAPIESASATSYWSSIVTLVLSWPVSDILQVFCREKLTPVFHRILGVFPLD